MREALTRIFTVALLTLVSMGGRAQIPIDLGGEKNDGVYAGGTIAAKQNDAKDGKVTVTLIATPETGYTINRDDIYVYETISPSTTRADEQPTVGNRLKLDGPEGDVSKATEYTVTVDANLGLWIKEAKFKDNGSKGGNRGTSDVGLDYSGTYYIASNYIQNNVNKYDPVTHTNNYYLCPTEGWAFYHSTDDVNSTNNGQPFLTTHKKSSTEEAKYRWIVEKHTINGVDYYSFKYGIDYNDGGSSISRYLSYNRQLSGAGIDRLRIHLEKTATPGDNELFRIVPYSTYLVISPKNTDADDGNKTKYLTVNGGNDNNYKGVTGKDGGPSGYEKTTKGIIGTYKDITDINAPFFLEDVIKRPTISYSSANSVTISYSSSAKIYYTTDGSDPTTSTTRLDFTGTSQSVTITNTNCAVVKAVAYINEKYSNIATYVFIQTGSGNPYLLQSAENNNFYMVKGDVNSSSQTTVNTSSFPQAGMSWYFEDAGSVSDVQYFYISNSTGGYLRRSNNSFYINATKEDNNDYKFALSPYLNESGTLTGFSLFNIGKTQYVYKEEGNGSNKAVNLITNANQDIARWNLVLVENKDFSLPISPSDNTSTTYYTFTSSEATTNLITPPTGTATYVTTSTGVSDSQKWYFKAAGDDGWASYYYILNAVTGEAMYFNGSTETTAYQANALQMEPLSGETNENADRYKFALAKTITDGEYYIVPKALAQYTKTNYSGVWYVGATSTLQTQSNRANNKIKWQISEVQNYVAPPYITYVLSTNTMTMSCTTPGAAIYYTIKGETPSTTSPNTIAPADLPNSFVLPEGADAIRAIAYKESVGTSTISEYDVVIQLTISDADVDLRPYLIQSQNNAWNSTDFHFYMIPGDDEGDSNSNITRVNTTSLFRPSMEWYFKNADEEGGIQYYFIVNKGGKNLCYDTTNGVYMDTNTDNADKFKFSIARYPATGTLIGYNLIPYGLTSGDRFIHKGNNNDNVAAIILNNDGSKANSQWKFVTKENLNTLAPFEVSNNSSTTYYKIGSVGSTGYYIVPPTGSGTSATTSNSSDTEVVKSMHWYFELVDGTPTDNDWLPYYYVRNAETDDYLYFANDDNNTGACLEMRSTIESGEEDKYMFTWARTATENTYYIVPKKLKDKQQNQISSLQRNSSTLQSGLTRSAGNYAWTFSLSDICLNPKIEYANGSLTMTCNTKPSEIYFTTDGSDPNPSKTKYNGALDTYDDNDQIYIKAVAVRENDHNVVSDIITYIKNPDVIFEDGYDFSYTGLAKEPPVSSVTVTPTGSTTPVEIDDSEFAIIYGDDNGEPYINAGVATVTISDAITTNNIIISGKAPFTITPKSLGDGTTAAEGIIITVTKTKTGDTYTYSVTVKNGESVTLTENTDYILSDAITDDSGYRVTINGEGNYSGGAKIIYVKAAFPTETNEESGGFAAAYQASIDLAAPSGLKAYIVTGIDYEAETVEVEELAYIPKDVPVLLLTEGGAPHDADFTATAYTVGEGEAADVTGNWLRKSNGTESSDWGQYYIFSKGEFVLSMGGKTIKAGKFYLSNDKYSGSSPSRAPSMLSFSRGGTSTTIDGVSLYEKEPLAPIWYTLEGQKLNKKPTRRGIYIQNGKKIIIK